MCLSRAFLQSIYFIYAVIVYIYRVQSSNDKKIGSYTVCHLFRPYIENGHPSSVCTQDCIEHLFMHHRYTSCTSSAPRHDFSYAHSELISFKAIFSYEQALVL